MKTKNDLALISRYKKPLMGFAALMIYLFHQWEFQWLRPELSPPLLDFAVNFVQRIGFFGVDIFFLLSGMGLIYAIEKGSLISFYSRRIERVYPAFFISGLLHSLTMAWTATEFLKKVLLYDFFFVKIDSILWFVPAIIVLYLLFPLYYQGFKRAGSKSLFTAGAILIWLVASIGLTGILRVDFYSATNRIPVFLLGIYFGWYIKERDFSFKLRHGLIALLMLVSGLYLMYLTSYKDLFLLVPASNCCIPALLLAIPTVLIMAEIFALLDRAAPTRWATKLFSFFGGISLELYCMHGLVDGALRPRLCISYEYTLAHHGRINLIIFICAVFAAFVLHYLCNLLLRGIHTLKKEKRT